ncbi:MAG: Eco57I restriction-modification methylase domain-containing protein [Chloroflexota bacterium]|nr:Eco57I restriction-modification methylase domain-containing protein [Chloroflexota bacterium]
MPIINPDDAYEVERAIQGTLVANESDRPAALRQLFVEVLDFEPETGTVSLETGSGVNGLPSAATRLAGLDGFHVLHIGLNGSTRRGIRRPEVRLAAQAVANQLGDDMLLAFTDHSGGQFQLVHPEFGDRRILLRRLSAELGRPHRTTTQQIARIYWDRLKTGSARLAIEQAFDVEPVTKRFFAEYRKVFESTEAAICGFAETDSESLRQFVQTMFNRLMFIYFLQRKGWLEFNGDENYLNALWGDYEQAPEQTNFYSDRLCPLFIAGLNNPNSGSVGDGKLDTPEIGRVPFLNGGLFEEGPLDRQAAIEVPDEAILSIFRDLFDRFNFTVTESTPFDVEVAVDPEMLGKVFEELVTDRQETGSYYTPRHVVSFMCREALKGFLRSRNVGVSARVLNAFLDEHRTDGIDVASARRLAQALSDVTVIDPACGSGAYLLGMLQELVELQTTLYNAGADAQTLYDLKLEIIQQNLFGADSDAFALNIAMLRMWLSLAIDYEGDEPVPLPNLDFKLVQGDSLLGPTPGSLTLHRHAINSSGIAQLKSRYMLSHDDAEKRALREQIAAVSSDLESTLGPDSHQQGAIDWRIEFAEVFSVGGFDIALANPPYRPLQANGGELAGLYGESGYETFARTGDIYQLFYERGCQLLHPESGQLAYITSNSWLRTRYGHKLRNFFKHSHSPLAWIDLGKDVFESAIVDSGILLLRTGGKASQFPAVDMDWATIKEFPPPVVAWGSIDPSPDRPWSVLSNAERSTFNKLHCRGAPLSDWGVSMNFGIKTGFNRAFIIDRAMRDELIAEDPSSAEVIKPVLRGRDVGRWRDKWAEQWLVYIPWHFPLHGDESTTGASVSAEFEFKSQYPAVYRHLDSHRGRLESRNQSETGIRYEWYALQRWAAKYHAEFKKPKLFWMDMTERGRFCYSEQEMYCNDKAFILTGQSLKYLCAVLNSTLIWWFVKLTGPTTGMGLTEWKKYLVESIPIPKPSAEQEQSLVELVDQILTELNRDPNSDVSDYEIAIDDLVYELYGLTEEEDTAIERALDLIHQTDEAEDEAILQSILNRSEEDREIVSMEEMKEMLRSSVES